MSIHIRGHSCHQPARVLQSVRISRASLARSAKQHRFGTGPFDYPKMDRTGNGVAWALEGGVTDLELSTRDIQSQDNNFLAENCNPVAQNRHPPLPRSFHHNIGLHSQPPQLLLVELPRHAPSSIDACKSLETSPHRITSTTNPRSIGEHKEPQRPSKRFGVGTIPA